MNTERARQGSASLLRIKHILLGNVCVIAMSAALAMTSSPAAAKTSVKHRHDRKDTEHASKEPFGNMPKGPLEIFVSINQQKLHFYSNGVHIADEPVATGVPGHLTPLGVFSVIQRDRYHHSNIYDNAPMPFMERITWSGVALHEGGGLGHQASHGCIRMPHDFAARLWLLHTMGMRVIIARPELRPLDFADSHLFVHKDKLPPTASLPHGVETAQAVTPGTKTDVVTPLPVHAPADTGSVADPAKLAPAAAAPAAVSKPATAEVKTPAPVASQAPNATPADAVTTGANNGAQPAAAETKQTQAGPAPASPVAAAGAEPAKAADPTPAAAAATPAVAATPADAAKTEPANAATAGATPATATPAQTTPPPGEASTIAPPDLTAPVAATIQQVPLPPSKPNRIAEHGTGGPIAIFISRREHRIYVRQNFTPLFDAPISIEHPDQPLGTHVFTAMDFMPDHSTFHWTVVTMPGDPPKATDHYKFVKDANGHRKRVRVEERSATAVLPPPETPREALARIDIPQDVVDQISQLIVPGSSLIVSDQGLGPETGRGTDFIVVTR